MKPIAVLGAGPAGLLAAHAVGLAGHPVVIFSTGGKSRLGGAQFMHVPIPELTGSEPDATVRYMVHGNAHTYQHKGYGSGKQPSFVSFGNVHDGMEQKAWNLQRAYEALWMVFGDNVNETKVDRQWLLDNHEDFRLIINSVPRPIFCADPSHQFYSQQVIIDPHPPAWLEDMTVLYDGTNDHSWYRASSLWGHGGTEWGLQRYDTVPYDVPDAVAVRKPLEHSCKCSVTEPDNIIRVGRFGKWEKGVLVHDGFHTTIRQLHDRGLLNLEPKA